MANIGSFIVSGSSGQAENKPIINPTGHANTGSTGQAENKPTINPGVTGHTSNTTGSSGQAETKPIINPTGNATTGSQEINKPTFDVTGHTSNTTDSTGQAETKLLINPGVTDHTTKPNATPKKEAITDLYMQDGDDYTIDDNAFSNVQMGTGDDKKAASVVGSGGDDSETNSNVNTSVFGGPSRAAHPGYSLW